MRRFLAGELPVIEAAKASGFGIRLNRSPTVFERLENPNRTTNIGSDVQAGNVAFSFCRFPIRFSQMFEITFMLHAITGTQTIFTLDNGLTNPGTSTFTGVGWVEVRSDGTLWVNHSVSTGYGRVTRRLPTDSITDTPFNNDLIIQANALYCIQIYNACMYLNGVKVYEIPSSTPQGIPPSIISSVERFMLGRFDNLTIGCRRNFSISPGTTDTGIAISGFGQIFGGNLFANYANMTVFEAMVYQPAGTHIVTNNEMELVRNNGRGSNIMKTRPGRHLRHYWRFEASRLSGSGFVPLVGTEPLVLIQSAFSTLEFVPRLGGIVG